MVAIKDNEYLLRLEKLAVIQSLNVAILTSKSATMALEKWCIDNDLPIEAKTSNQLKITASTIKHPIKTPNQQQLNRLSVSDMDKVKFRHVCLNWAGSTVSEAYNWYVEDRLTVEMNDMLKNSDIPFGKVIEELGFYRQTFSSRLLYDSLPDGLDKTTNIFEHRALLFNKQHQPISEVWEIYNSNLLNFK